MNVFYREQAPVLPPELWAIILRILPKFSDIVNAVRAKRRFRMLEDAPKIYLDMYVFINEKRQRHII